MADESDEALMEAFAAGELKAFELLVERHNRRLYNFLLRHVGNAARAEELLQEVLLRVVGSKGRYRRTAKFSTWLYTIARNICVDESRRARFRDHQSLDAKAAGASPGGAWGDSGPSLVQTLPADQVPTDEAADAERMRARLAAAVSTLPDEQREVFLMRQIAGLSFREIGEAVGVPENTVKSRMRYALDKLRQELADVHPEAELATAKKSSTTGKEVGVHG